MLPTPQKRTVEVDCPSHGRQDVEQVKLFQDFAEPRCPVCDKERRAERDAEDQRRADAAKAEAVRRGLESRLSNAMIPPRFSGKTLESYAPAGDGAVKALAVCRDYAADFDRYYAAGTGMILCGNTGTGKTHLACGVALEVIHRRGTAAYVTAGRAFRMVKETFVKGGAQTEQQAYDWFVTPDLLIIDEVGVQYGSDSERNILFEIINARYEKLRPCVLISNLALPALKEYAGDRVIDRMREGGGKMIIFDWQSHRGAASC